MDKNDNGTTTFVNIASGDVSKVPTDITVTQMHNDVDEGDFDLPIDDERLYRMYCLVLKQLSPMQKGIQSAHAIVEYADLFGDTTEYKEWSKLDKTIIVLDGGTLFDLDDIREKLDEHEIKYAEFMEEDLGMITTAFCFIVDDRVFDDETYPDFYTWRNRKYPNRSILTGFTYSPSSLGEDIDYSKHYKEWIDTVIEGENNEFLRELIMSKRLAN